MLHQANIPEDHCVYFWNKCFETATKVDDLAAVTIDGITKTRYEHWFGSNPTFVNHLRTWGEAGVVMLTTNLQPKLCGSWFELYVCWVCDRSRWRCLLHVESQD
jgi:hypothetical protein